MGDNDKYIINKHVAQYFFTDRRHEWYIARYTPEPKFPGDCQYLHSDGEWRYSTTNEYNQFTGYFETEQDAKDCLAKHS